MVLLSERRVGAFQVLVSTAIESWVRVTRKVRSGWWWWAGGVRRPQIRSIVPTGRCDAGCRYMDTRPSELKLNLITESCICAGKTEVAVAALDGLFFYTNITASFLFRLPFASAIWD